MCIRDSISITQISKESRYHAFKWFRNFWMSSNDQIRRFCYSLWIFKNTCRSTDSSWILPSNQMSDNDDAVSYTHLLSSKTKASSGLTSSFWHAVKKISGWGLPWVTSSPQMESSKYSVKFPFLRISSTRALPLDAVYYTHLLFAWGSSLINFAHWYWCVFLAHSRRYVWYSLILLINICSQSSIPYLLTIAVNS